MKKLLLWVTCIIIAGFQLSAMQKGRRGYALTPPPQFTRTCASIDDLVERANAKETGQKLLNKAWVIREFMRQFFGDSNVNPSIVDPVIAELRNLKPYHEYSSEAHRMGFILSSVVYRSIESLKAKNIRVDFELYWSDILDQIAVTVNQANINHPESAWRLGDHASFEPFDDSDDGITEGDVSDSTATSTPQPRKPFGGDALDPFNLGHPAMGFGASGPEQQSDDE